MPTSILRSAFWSRLDRPGAESFRLSSTDSGFRLAGVVLLFHREQGLRLRYSIDCGRDWTTRAVEVNVEDGREPRSLRLAVDSDRHWRRPDGEVAEAGGCADVDLSFSPSTNTLPIRRLNLPVGESAEVAAAWVLVPDLEVKRLPQRYTRLSDRRYRYESRGGEFTAELEVDEQGLVRDYPGIWKREG